jgi:murein DD-endopeptidase MepM/ murein hydrolase activator NlpD
MGTSNNRPGPKRRSVVLALAGTVILAAALTVASGAPAQSLQEIQQKLNDSRAQLDQKQSQLQHAKDRAGVLSTTIQKYGDQLDQLRNQVASLRNQISIVQTQLNKKEAELKQAKARLAELRAKLKRSLRILRQRLVDIYESNTPDAMTVILNSHGFRDMLTRYDYLQKIQSQDTSIAVRVKDLRNQEKRTVDRVRAARNAIANKKAELEQSQAALESKQADLVDARQKDQQILGQVQQTKDQLEGDVGDISAQIASQLQAQQQAQAAQAAAQAQASPSSTGTSTAPTGPVQGESSSGMIWPVNGPITSPFCEQRAWESCHPGIDIGVPSGTPIHAAAAGTVSIAGPESGYGNYTCIDHGGGLSTCYAHQESISVSVGQQVSQGQVIGISDCTGLCFGPHLHFEVRVNGQPVDPMGYLP